MGNPNYPRALGNAAGTLQMIRRALEENRPLDALNLAEAGLQQAVEVLREYPPATVPNTKPEGPANRTVTFSTQAKQCQTCRHTGRHSLQEPCNSCSRSEMEYSKWEPVETTLETLSQLGRDATKSWPQWMQDAGRVANASFPRPTPKGETK